MSKSAGSSSSVSSMGHRAAAAARAQCLTPGSNTCQSGGVASTFLLGDYCAQEHHDTPRPSLSGRLFTCHVNPSPSYMSSPPLQTGVISRRHCAVTCCTPFGPSGVKRVYILSFFHPGRKEQPRTGALRWRCIIVRVSADHDEPNDPIRPDAC